MSRWILALDQGTTSSRAILFDRQGLPQGIAQQEFPQLYPSPGHVEHDPEAIWSSQLQSAREALQRVGATAGDVAAVGVTNQRETTILWDRTTGRAIAPAIVWQSRITADRCEHLRRQGLEPFIRERTGLVLDAYFSATKIQYLLETIPGARAAAERGDVLFGTVETFLMWRLSGGRLHVTDVSNASRTLLMNLRTLQWDDELLKLFDVPRAMLPEIRGCSEIYGETDSALFGTPIPLAGAAGDQQAATFGQACWTRGMAKNTYGTGCFLLMNTGDEPVLSSHGLVSTVAWRVGNQVTYALEGSVFVAGAAVQWLRDGLGLIAHAAETEALAASLTSNDGVYFVPAFVGLGAPYWDAEARGLLIGLTRGTTRAHLARATLEAMAYQTRDVLEAMQRDSGVPLTELRVDGGATANNWLCQRQADVLGSPVLRPVVQETTALGAAYLAGLAVGYWHDLDELKQNWNLDREFQPAVERRIADDDYARWQRAVERSRHWTTTDM